MKYLKGSFVLALLVGFILMLSNCERSEMQAQLTYKTYCGNCHSLPDPTQITKERWQNKILPEMGARLGMSYDSYDPFAAIPANEAMLVRSADIYPEKPMLTEAEWKSLCTYVLAIAPDSIPLDLTRKERNQILDLFEAKGIQADDRPGSMVTSLNWNNTNSSVVGTDAGGKVWKWEAQSGVKQLHSYGKALVDYSEWGETELVTEIGTMQPTDQQLGKLWITKGENDSTLIDDLQRPVYTKIADLNRDGTDEIIVCEFGNRMGQLSLLVKGPQGYRRSSILKEAGAISLKIADFNKDGLDDIMALFAQGDEGVYIFYQGANLSFVSKRVIGLDPTYGTSAFDVFDYENDGDLDLVIATGDNEENPPLLKASHGLRLFINNGRNDFRETLFYPIYGATQVKAADFDLDGDIDFAVSSFFPDFENNPAEGFVYLENIYSEKYTLKAYTTDMATKGRWIVMEKGDFDNDGDTDLMLGCFTIPPSFESQMEINEWFANSYDLMLFENKQIRIQ